MKRLKSGHSIDNLSCGDVLEHVLGFNVSVVKVTEHSRGREMIKMIKCRFMDKQGMLHKFEFFPKELKKVD